MTISFSTNYMTITPTLIERLYLRDEELDLSVRRPDKRQRVVVAHILQRLAVDGHQAVAQPQSALRHHHRGPVHTVHEDPRGRPGHLQPQAAAGVLEDGDGGDVALLSVGGGLNVGEALQQRVADGLHVGGGGAGLVGGVAFQRADGRLNDEGGGGRAGDLP